jgi:hypothetical protein
MNRAQRRFTEKNNKIYKENNFKSDNKNLMVELEKKFETIVLDLNSILKYTKNIEFKFNILLETMFSKNLISLEDIKNTEKVFLQKPAIKLEAIKKILKQELTLEETLLAIKEDAGLPNYKRLNIDPVLDLNINPFEIAQLIRDKNPSSSPEEHYNLGSKLYNLKKYHFGLEEIK